MKEESTTSGEREAAQPPAEFFCIHSYAGSAGPPCGWRGAGHETWRDSVHGARRCPRCGRATLFELPRG